METIGRISLQDDAFYVFLVQSCFSRCWVLEVGEYCVSVVLGFGVYTSFGFRALGF